LSRILTAAFASSQVALLLIGYQMRSAALEQSDSEPVISVLFLIGLGFLLAAGKVSAWLWGMMRKSSSSPSHAVKTFLPALLVGHALREAAALIGFVVYCILGAAEWMLLLLCLGAAVAMVLALPKERDFDVIK
ncbi:MAG: hypothetical protein KDD42_06765, partial [Bdellovibrionales bacterium]|nr:hypothetical protein [Bdellovibrionales bacterium]